MVMNYQDVMAICRVFGSPDLFVTFTCNSKWQEIAELIRFEDGQQPSNRPDMIARVFNMKVHEFITNIREGRTFGPVLQVKMFPFPTSSTCVYNWFYLYSSNDYFSFSRLSSLHG